MRGKRAKQLRKLVRERYAFLSPDTIYRIMPTNVWRVGETCQRAWYKALKKDYKYAKQRGAV